MVATPYVNIYNTYICKHDEQTYHRVSFDGDFEREKRKRDWRLLQNADRFVVAEHE